MQPRRPFLSRLPYIRNVAPIFQPLARKPWAVWLDSGEPGACSGRYDILAADPTWKIVKQGPITQILDRNDRVQKDRGEPLAMLRELLAGDEDHAIGDIPLTGGAIGYFSYDLGREFEALPVRASESGMPELAIGVYDWVVVVDHVTQRAWLAGQGRDPKTAREWDSLLAQFTSSAASKIDSGPWRLSAIEYNLSHDNYTRAFSSIQSYIHEGDCYQVNFAQRFRADFEGDAWSLYLRQRGQNPAPYGAYLNLPFGQILSSSPEQFLGLEQGRVITRPIKGTRPRGKTLKDDEAAREALLHSPKDRAENLMIVDLLRNDLGKVCVPGSISVPALFTVESFPTVHHLVSTVEGRLAPVEDALSLFRASFPGGSITGAPKHRAMQIIDELETERRGVYCGSVGWIGFNGNMDSNITIRTLVLHDGEASYWAGGGIVADSDQDAEYQESLDKAVTFFRLATSG